MDDTCPGEKYKAQWAAPAECETVKEEVVREKVLRMLTAEKGFRWEELEVDLPYDFQVGEERVQSRVSIIVRLGGRRLLLVQCGAGSILARERPSLSLARLIEAYQIPLTLVTNGEDATLLDTRTGDTLECGMGAIPSREWLAGKRGDLEFVALPEKRLQMEKRILSAFEALSLHGECQ